MGIVLTVCSFITLWILIIAYGWSKMIKSMDKDIKVTLDREEHKKKMADMKKEHDKMSSDFEKRWSGLKR